MPQIMNSLQGSSLTKLTSPIILFILWKVVLQKRVEKFSKRDRVAAMTFAKVAIEYRVKLIIYLGGLIHAEEEEDDDDGKLSQHICEVERR
jgi:hypothetical protein